MPNVVVTFHLERKKSVDLEVPEHVPSQLLATTVAHALKIPVTEEQVAALEWLLPERNLVLSPTVSLQKAGVVNGSHIQLLFQKFPRKSGLLISDDMLKIALKKMNIIGRSTKNKPVDIDLAALDINKLVSRIHASIQQSRGQFFIQDLHSRNGTWLDGKEVTPEAKIPLKSGMKISFGPEERGLKMVFRLTD